MSITYKQGIIGWKSRSNDQVKKNETDGNKEVMRKLLPYVGIFFFSSKSLEILYVSTGS